MTNINGRRGGEAARCVSTGVWVFHPPAALVRGGRRGISGGTGPQRYIASPRTRARFITCILQMTIYSSEAVFP